MDKEKKLLYLVAFAFIVLLVLSVLQLIGQRVPNEFTEAFLERNSLPEKVKAGEEFTINMFLTNNQIQDLNFEFFVVEGELANDVNTLIVRETGLINANIILKGKEKIKKKEMKKIPLKLKITSPGEKKVEVKFKHEKEYYFHSLYFWTLVE